jgi:hypothetical protein
MLNIIFISIISEYYYYNDYSYNYYYDCYYLLFEFYEYHNNLNYSNNDVVVNAIVDESAYNVGL